MLCWIHIPNIAIHIKLLYVCNLFTFLKIYLAEKYLQKTNKWK